MGQMPLWFVGGLFGLVLASISFGQEGRSAPLLYSLPVTASQVLRAKMLTALTVALAATVTTFALVTVISRPPFWWWLEGLLVAVAITVEEVMLGLGFGAKFPDFQERPRPRFVDPLGIIVMMLVGTALMVVTALPLIIEEAFAGLPGILIPTDALFLVALAFATAVAGLAYSWAARTTSVLLAEFRT